jgi:K+-transporting ATPase ATPase C chain
MKNLMKSIRITLVFCLFFAVFYILILLIFAHFAGPGKDGNAETVTLNGKVVGVANVGQTFTKDIFFWGRPSCAGNGYDASSSAGSNKGPSNKEYLAEVEARIDTFLVHHPYLSRKEVPAEMVTASASGLDPDITPESAYVQVKRVASARRMSEAKVKEIVAKAIEKPLLGLFGPAKVNVLKLNVALEEINPTIK